MAMKTPDFTKIRILYRDGNLQLWGIPYLLRPGQSPRDIQRAHEEYVPPRYGHHGGRRSVGTGDWIWLGTPGWYGSYSDADVVLIKTFLKVHANDVPGNHYEYSILGR
jgi:hypothetical protein